MTEIYLKVPSRQDKDFFYKWRNDKKIYKWCRQVDEISRVHHDNYWYLTETSQDRKFWSIIANGDGYIDSTIGCAGLTDIDYVNSRAEFSLYIDPREQGKGFGKRALKELFSKGFNILNLNLIWGETFDGNPAEKMFKDLGMVKEGTRKEFYYRDGEYIDAHLYSITRKEFSG